MSRIKVKEETLGPLIAGGAEFVFQTWHDYLQEADAEPIAIEHELPFNSFTSLIE
jgi:hypothetical protein